MEEKDKDTEVQEGSESASDDPVDSESVKGIFGWETIDDTSIPYILRKGKKFVSVRIVERKLLSKYPNTFPDELGKKDPLTSYFITDAEATLLHEINSVHCDYEYGRTPFTAKDLIVDFDEFGEFFKVVKKTFPADILAKMGNDSTESSEPVTPEISSDRTDLCGWIQINNTVSPYIVRIDRGIPIKYVPMHVIIYAAGLMANQNVDGLPATLQECTLLNEGCKAAGVDFTFSKSTKLLSITEVLQRCEVQLFDLPPKNPLQFARYLDPRSGHPSSCLLRSQMSQPAPMASSPSLTPSPVQTHMQPSKMDMMGAVMSNMKSFMPGHPAMGMHPRLAAMGFMQMRPHGDAAMMQQKLHEMSQQSEQLGLQGGPRFLWPNMQQGPPPAHMGNNPRPSSHKTPPLPQEGQPSYKPYGGSRVATSPPLHHKTSMGLPEYSHAKGLPDYNHPIFHSAPSGSGQGQLLGNIRYPPPRMGLPQVPPSSLLPPHHSFGANQFDSSLFQKQQSETNSGQPKLKRKNSQDVASHHSESTSPNGNRSMMNRSPLDAGGSAAPSRPLSGANLSAKITACLVNGKSISCLQLESGPRTGNFCLVEAVSKLYFPSVQLAEFVKVLQMVLQVQLYECSEHEEAAFVQYYNLPVKKLKCNKIVRVEDLEKYFPQLNYMFSKFVNENNSDTQSSSSSSGQQAAGSSFSPLKRSAPTPPSAAAPTGKPNIENVVQKLSHDRLAHGTDLFPGEVSSAPGSSSCIVLDD